MALEKVITYDYEIRGEYKNIQERKRTAVVEDGEEISFSYHRRTLSPDMDVSSESDEIKGMASALWSDEVKATDSYFAGEQIINKLDNDGNANPEYEFVKDTDGITYLSKLNDKDSMYVSAIKELLAKIETLESKVAALEGK